MDWATLKGSACQQPHRQWAFPDPLESLEIMSLENLTIHRLIIHEVYARSDDRAPKPPLLGEQLLDLSEQAKTALQQRITDALGDASHGIEMAIQATGDGSAFQSVEAILAAADDDPAFVRITQDLAHGLTTAQASRAIPGGILVVIDGRCGHPAKRFIAVIKAEPHAGFSRRQDAHMLSLDFIEDLILTPQAKLYKIGFFIQAEQGCRALLYDHLISRGNRQAAAQYFYARFLGLAFPTNSAYLTQCFYTHSRDFIRTAPITPDRKIDLLNALTIYLKTDQASTIQAQEFAERYLSESALIDSFLAHLHANDVPATAFAKDLGDIHGKLKLRHITFGNNIKFIAPADQFDDFVAIEMIKAEDDDSGANPQWTRITVRGQIQDQS